MIGALMISSLSAICTDNYTDLLVLGQLVSDVLQSGPHWRRGFRPRERWPMQARQLLEIA
jgi:hypothetical protein